MMRNEKHFGQCRSFFLFVSQTV